MPPLSIPPWCPGRGDPDSDPDHAFQFDTVLMERFSYSYLSLSTCWSAPDEGRFSSVYKVPSMKGGMLSLPHKIPPRALCYFPRDSSSCIRENCGCGAVRANPTNVKEGAIPPYTEGVNCSGDLSSWKDASDTGVEQYVDRFHPQKGRTGVYTKHVNNRTHIVDEFGHELGSNHSIIPGMEPTGSPAQIEAVNEWAPLNAEGPFPSLNEESFARVAKRRLQWDAPGDGEFSTRPAWEGYGPPGWQPGYNEIVVSAWFGAAHSEVPVDAWFYFSGVNPKVTRRNKEAMRSMQRAYARASGRQLPLFKLSVLECNPRPFECEEE